MTEQSKHILCSTTFFWQLCHLWDNVEKCGTARQVADDNITRCIHLHCWIPKPTDTHSEYATLLLFLSNNGYTNAPRCYLMFTLLLLLHYIIFTDALNFQEFKNMFERYEFLIAYLICLQFLWWWIFRLLFYGLGRRVVVLMDPSLPPKCRYLLPFRILLTSTLTVETACIHC
jgi:hypothetical protein